MNELSAEAIASGCVRDLVFCCVLVVGATCGLSIPMNVRDDSRGKNYAKSTDTDTHIYKDG